MCVCNHASIHGQPSISHYRVRLTFCEKHQSFDTASAKSGRCTRKVCDVSSLPAEPSGTLENYHQFKRIRAMSADTFSLWRMVNGEDYPSFIPEKLNMSLLHSSFIALKQAISAPETLKVVRETHAYLKISFSSYRRLPVHHFLQRATSLTNQVLRKDWSLERCVPRGRMTPKAYYELLSAVAAAIEKLERASVMAVQTVRRAAHVLRHCTDVRLMIVFLPLGARLHTLIQGILKHMDAYSAALLGIRRKKPLEYLSLRRLRDEPLFLESQGMGSLFAMACRLRQALHRQEPESNKYTAD